MSCIENALMPFARSISFSARSTSLSPMYTSFFSDTLWSSSIHPNGPPFSPSASPVRNASGIPWMFPLHDDSGVLMSACASTHTTASSLPSLRRTARATPAMLPMAMLWSPPSVSTKRPAAACACTCSERRRVAAETAAGRFIPRTSGSAAGTRSAYVWIVASKETLKRSSSRSWSMRPASMRAWGAASTPGLHCGGGECCG